MKINKVKFTEEQIDTIDQSIIGFNFAAVCEKLLVEYANYGEIETSFVLSKLVVPNGAPVRAEELLYTYAISLYVDTEDCKGDKIMSVPLMTTDLEKIESYLEMLTNTLDQGLSVTCNRLNEKRN